MEQVKQTAVEWLFEQLEDKGDSWENVSIGRIQISIKVEDYLKLKQQAKAMEKEQVIEFGELVWKNLLRSDKIMETKDIYNETYGGNK